jgi:acyl-CoA synthetase (AMP-forming)/AMP-acid ligase II
VVLTPFYGRVKAVQPRTALTRVVATNVKEYLPPLLRVLFILARERRDGHRVRLQEGDQWLGDLLDRHREAPRPAVPLAPEDPAVILMSGGTTGTPKGVVGLHRHYTITGRQLGTWLQAGTAPWDDVIMAALPLPDVEMRVVDRAGARLPAGEVGEVLIRAPQLMAGYWDDPEETAATVGTADGERWLHTGDLGHLQGAGHGRVPRRAPQVDGGQGAAAGPHRRGRASSLTRVISSYGSNGLTTKSSAPARRATSWSAVLKFAVSRITGMAAPRSSARSRAQTV